MLTVFPAYFIVLQVRLESQNRPGMPRLCPAAQDRALERPEPVIRSDLVTDVHSYQDRRKEPTKAVQL